MRPHPARHIPISLLEGSTPPAPQPGVSVVTLFETMFQLERVDARSRWYNPTKRYMLGCIQMSKDVSESFFRRNAKYVGLLRIEKNPN